MGKTYNIDIKLINQAIHDYYNPAPTAIKHTNKIKIDQNYIPVPQFDSQPQDTVQLAVQKFSDESGGPQTEIVDSSKLEHLRDQYQNGSNGITNTFEMRGSNI